MLPKTRVARTVASVALLLAFVLVGAVVWTQWIAGGGRGDASSLGGSYTLTNTAGETVTPATFGEQYRLIYFGYTHCPGVCPQTLNAMTRALNQVGNASPAVAQRITPVFITIDPERDDRARIRTYLKNFHERFVGLTGSPERIAAAAEQFRVTYKKMKAGSFEKDSKMRKKAERVGYLMQHSSYVFLMGPDGGYVDHISTNANATQMAKMISKHVNG